MSTIRGIILDVDGTLVDSNDAHAHAWVNALKEAGIEVKFSEIRRMIGMGGDKLLPAATGIEEDTPPGRRISKRRGEIFKQRYLTGMRPTPGASELLQELSRRQLRLVVASSAKADELAPLLRVCDGDQYIESKTSSDDAENSKPDPDIVHAALDKLGLPAEAVIMLGDTPYDVEAAQRAGIDIICFRCGGWKDEDLTGAVAIYDHPADLLAHLDESPLAADALQQSA